MSKCKVIAISNQKGGVDKNDNTLKMNVLTVLMIRYQ